ncbi:MAG: 16S rRNA (uracil(1498)-N(3))-methyltransferase [Pseudomonadota bacterium]
MGMISAMKSRPKVRLFVNGPIEPNGQLMLTPDQSHYLTGVMRLKEGAQIAVFDGAGPEWCARIHVAHRKKTSLKIVEQTAPFNPPSDLWLLFAPIKKTRTDFIVEKATELGVARICPVFTDFTNAERLRVDRLNAHVIEAAEQCGGTAVPVLEEAQKLSSLLDKWPNERHLFFCDEDRTGEKNLDLPSGPAAVLIGPEGGFSESERQVIWRLPFTKSMHLGPRILRADTAVVAAITRWQSEVGDWSK